MPRAHRKVFETNGPVTFYINGKYNTVYGEYDIGTSLNDYIRDVVGLKGTKVMCKEGGCGCCAVTVTTIDHTTGKDTSFSINSCLCPLYSVDGWQITTIEGIGSRKDGYHPIQDRIAKMNGSQCGYCTPGMCMNMYGLLHQNPTPTQQDIEDQFDGNICRCTGYRPILDSMKTFATDSILPKCVDIEDLNKGLCQRSEMFCKQKGFGVSIGKQSWYRPDTLKHLCRIVKEYHNKKVRFVFGNTASGLYKEDGPFDVFLDLHNIKQLYQFQDSKVRTAGGIFKKRKIKYMEFGANMSITDLINTMDMKKSEKGYGYFEVIADHFRKIGSALVRNAASWAGNLMVKNTYPEFPSDIFTVLEAAGAHVIVMDCTNGSTKWYPLLSLITGMNMENKLIISLELYQQNETFRFRSYKITPRSQNSRAYVNAAFQFCVDDAKLEVLGKPSLVIGGINKNLTHATKTEASLQGKILTDKDVLKCALDTLSKELDPTPDPVLASPQYRRSAAVNLLYKFILEICGARDNVRMSGHIPIVRHLSTGVREFQEKKSDWPLKEPMPLLTAHAQASGEAEFVNDMPSSKHELYGAFVITSQGPATLENVDESAALELPGVVDYLNFKDIPNGGVNNYMSSIRFKQLAPQELFCSGKVLYAGQTVGLILAESQTKADEAAKNVNITYKDTRSPILTIDEAVAKGSFLANPLNEHVVGDPKSAMKNSTWTLSGECRSGSNYHFYTENQVSLCVPSEERLDVYASTQLSDNTQASVAMVTGLPLNNIVVTVPRLGGSFGGKGTDSVAVTAAAAVAAYKHNRPVKVSVNLSTNMKMTGKRYAAMAKYEVGFDDTGRVNVVIIEIYFDGGSSRNSLAAIWGTASMMDQGYHVPSWKIKLIACKTDKPPNTFMRAPSGLPGCFMIESVMEHVAKHLNRNPVEVKERNLYKQGQIDLKGHELTYCTLGKLWTDLRQWAEVDGRRNEINNFNKDNRWKKRALAMTPTKYGMAYYGGGYTVDVAIYGKDGTVTVSQGGVEMGQGLFTKVAQAVAMSLRIPVNKVKVLPNNSHISANSYFTGSSVSSELAVMSALKCCEILNERMALIREEHPDYSWKNLVKTCVLAGIELTAKNKTQPKRKDGPGESHYFTYCAGVTEVELDVLTGQNQIRRVDVLFDCGESLNPDIDIGQIEGSLVMGIGNLLLEDVIYDTNTGAVLNDGTWSYKPPTAKDIPVDIRIKLLPDAPNPVGVKGSKATGEPAILLATGAFYALKQAMELARAELTGSEEFQVPVAPLTVERLMLGCGVQVENLAL